MVAQTTEEVAMITLTTVTTAATGMTTMAATGMATIAATGMTTMAMTTGMVTMTTVIAPIDATSTSIGTERIVPPITIPTPVKPVSFSIGPLTPVLFLQATPVVAFQFVFPGNSTMALNVFHFRQRVLALMDGCGIPRHTLALIPQSFPTSLVFLRSPTSTDKSVSVCSILTYASTGGLGIPLPTTALLLVQILTRTLTQILTRTLLVTVLEAIGTASNALVTTSRTTAALDGFGIPSSGIALKIHQSFPSAPEATGMVCSV